MFSVTFLGHQGWLFTAGESRILVDPVLVETFGHGGIIGRMYPPRRINIAEFPPIDAVILSHEHEDHFNIPTLNQISRDVPIYLSVRSSIVARELVREMGFEVRLLDAGEKVVFGELEYYTLSPDHNQMSGTDEWDVLPFFVRDAAGHGSFFTNIDVPTTEDMESIVECVLGERHGLWCYTNNTNVWSFMFAGRVLDEFPRSDTFAFATEVITHHSKMRFQSRRPAGVLFGGGGLSFAGERAWLNQHVFTTDSERVARALEALCPDQLVAVPVPGQTFHMADNRVVRVDEATPFLRAAPREEWPSREYRPTVTLAEEYAPATGRREITAREHEEIVQHLARFAEHLYATETFRQLFSFVKKDFGGRRGAFAMLLLDEGPCGWTVLEYEPQSCSFKRAECDDPFGDYLAGMECWASDLLAVLRGEMSSSAIVFGRARRWNYMPERFHFTIAEFWRYIHPLRRPDLAARLYHQILAVQPAEVPRIQASRP